jgi:hypothetical protein
MGGRGERGIKAREREGGGNKVKTQSVRISCKRNKAEWRLR